MGRARRQIAAGFDDILGTRRGRGASSWSSPANTAQGQGILKGIAAAYENDPNGVIAALNSERITADTIAGHVLEHVLLERGKNVLENDYFLREQLNKSNLRYSTYEHVFSHRVQEGAPVMHYFPAGRPKAVGPGNVMQAACGHILLKDETLEVRRGHWLKSSVLQRCEQCATLTEGSPHSELEETKHYSHFASPTVEAEFSRVFREAYREHTLQRVQDGKEVLWTLRQASLFARQKALVAALMQWSREDMRSLVEASSVHIRKAERLLTSKNVTWKQVNGALSEAQAAQITEYIFGTSKTLKDHPGLVAFQAVLQHPLLAE
jgi:hypothetical protein